MTKLFDRNKISEVNTECDKLLVAMNQRMRGESPTEYLPNEIHDLLEDREDLRQTYIIAKHTVQTDSCLLAVDIQGQCPRTNTRRSSCQCDSCPKLFEALCTKNELLRFATTMILRLGQILSFLDAIHDIDSGNLDFNQNDMDEDDMNEDNMDEDNNDENVMDEDDVDENDMDEAGMDEAGMDEDDVNQGQ